MPPTSARELLIEERRLFYVACTRARQRLVVTAVASPDDDGEQPSRFLDELGVTVERSRAGRAARSRWPAWSASCAVPLADPETSPALRGAAARRLARLAAETVGDRSLVPMADPSTWWGTRAASRSVQPVRDPDQPVPVSASVLEAIWAARPSGSSSARPAASPGPTSPPTSASWCTRSPSGSRPVSSGPADDAASTLMDHVDAVWDRLEFRTPWSKAREHERVRAALGASCAGTTPTRAPWSAPSRTSTPSLDLPDGEQVQLTGYADRLELDADGRVVVVDLKTGRTKPTDKSVPTNVQLGLYQFAVDHGAVDEPRRRARRAEAGGAELVQLGLTRRRARRGRPGPGRRRPRTAPSATLLRAQLGDGRALLRARAVPGRRRPALPRLPLRADLPGQERGTGDVVTPVDRLPDDLATAMGADCAPSEQQWAAISAPLEPAVVIAGAGSGKTTLMAARVVYLVVTGQVRPDEVLGLTFTTKAASELRARIRERPARRGRARTRPSPDDEDVLEPTVATYNAYAAGLLTDHGLRIGHEPDTRVITDAARYQLGARAVDRYTGEVAHLTDHPATAIQNLLALDGAMSEHLVGPDDVRALRRRGPRRVRASARRGGAGKNRKTYRDRSRRRSTRSTGAASCSAWWRPTGG